MVFMRREQSIYDFSACLQSSPAGILTLPRVYNWRKDVIIARATHQSIGNALENIPVSEDGLVCLTQSFFAPETARSFCGYWSAADMSLFDRASASRAL
jgi:hypothetical protein